MDLNYKHQEAHGYMFYKIYPRSNRHNKVCVGDYNMNWLCSLKTYIKDIVLTSENPPHSVSPLAVNWYAKGYVYFAYIHSTVLCNLNVTSTTYQFTGWKYPSEHGHIL